MKWNVLRKDIKKAIKTFLSITVISRNSFLNHCVVYYKNPITESKFTKPKDVVPFSSFCLIEQSKTSYYSIGESIKCLKRVSGKWEQNK